MKKKIGILNGCKIILENNRKDLPYFFRKKLIEEAESWIYKWIKESRGDILVKSMQGKYSAKK